MIIREAKTFQHELDERLDVGSCGKVDQRHKLVAAKTRCKTSRRKDLGEPGCKAAQQGIGASVPDTLVDLLEAIEIERDQAEATPIGLSPLNLFIEASVEKRTVREASQAVVCCGPFELLLRCLSFGDVPDKGYHGRLACYRRSVRRYDHLPARLGPGDSRTGRSEGGWNTDPSRGESR
nr:hypothetical protein [Sphingomonas aerophila]